MKAEPLNACTLAHVHNVCLLFVCVCVHVCACVSVCVLFWVVLYVCVLAPAVFFGSVNREL